MAFAALLYKKYKYSKKVFEVNDKIDNDLIEKNKHKKG